MGENNAAMNLENEEVIDLQGLDISSMKLFTELLVAKDKLSVYMPVTTREAKRKADCCDLRGWSREKTKKRNVENGGKASTWATAAKWVKYLQVLENDRKKYSSPHITTLSPHYIDILENSVTLGKVNTDHYNVQKPVSNSEIIHQKVFVSDNGSNSQDLSVVVDKEAYTWVVENGSAHDRFEVARCIGGIFSVSENIGVVADLSFEGIKQAISDFKKMSTLVPFNSWDPRFRMQPATGGFCINVKHGQTNYPKSL